MKESNWKFQIGDWGDNRTFDEICDNSKFTYFFCIKGQERLAPGDNGKPHVVHSEDKEFLRFTQLEACGGIVVDGEGSAGKGYMQECGKTFDLYLEKDAREAIAAYLILAGLDEFILQSPSHSRRA